MLTIVLSTGIQKYIYFLKEFAFVLWGCLISFCFYKDAKIYIISINTTKANFKDDLNIFVNFGANCMENQKEINLGQTFFFVMLWCCVMGLARKK